MPLVDAGHPLAAVLGVLLCAIAGWRVPSLIAALPEPEPEPLVEPVPQPVPPTAGERPEPAPAAAAKELYADIARLERLAWRAAAVSGLIGGVIGAALGLEWTLVVWLPLVPVGVALGLIDWRTRLLPTRIVAPSYALVVVALLLAALGRQDLGVLRGAGMGWLLYGGIFVLLWLINPRGMGYGDVRLSGVLGLALGATGLPVLLTGLYATFLVGPLAGLVLSGFDLKKRYPFGPFMLLGALLGVVFGPVVLSGLLG